MSDIWIGSISALVGTALGATIPVMLESHRDKTARKYSESEKYEAFNRAMFTDFLPILNKLIFSLVIERVEFNDQPEVKSSDLALKDYQEARAIFDAKIKENYPLELVDEIEVISTTFNRLELGLNSRFKVINEDGSVDNRYKIDASKSLKATSEKIKEKLKSKYF